MNKFHTAILTALIVSFGASAAVIEQQWGDWRNSGGMAFPLFTENKAGEELTLSCSGHELVVAYEDKKSHYRVDSTEGLNDMYVLINKKAYALELQSYAPGEPIPAQVTFDALKRTGPKDKIAFTSAQSGESKPFSAKGLSDALDGITWQDCTQFP